MAKKPTVAQQDTELPVTDNTVVVEAFFGKYGNYRLGSGPTIEELYQAFVLRSKLPTTGTERDASNTCTVCAFV